MLLGHLNVVLCLVILCHDLLHAHKAPQLCSIDQVVDVRIQKCPQHEHESPDYVAVNRRTSVQITMTRNGLEEGTVQHDELDVDLRQVGLVELVHVGGDTAAPQEC